MNSYKKQHDMSPDKHHYLQFKNYSLKLIDGQITHFLEFLI